MAYNRHRYILDIVRYMRFQASVSLNILEECALSVVYVINRLPIPTLRGMYPYEVVHSHPPSSSHLKVFGGLGYVIDLKRGDKF